jgi:hypothetical protein
LAESLLERFVFMSQLLPLDLHSLSAIGVGMFKGWWRRSAKVSYQPDDTQYSEQYAAY